MKGRKRIPLNTIVPVFILLPFFLKIKILLMTLKSGVVAVHFTLPGGSGDGGDGFGEGDDSAGHDGHDEDDGYFGAGV